MLSPITCHFPLKCTGDFWQSKAVRRRERCSSTSWALAFGDCYSIYIYIYITFCIFMWPKNLLIVPLSLAFLISFWWGCVYKLKGIFCEETPCCLQWSLIVIIVPFSCVSDLGSIPFDQMSSSKFEEKRLQQLEEENLRLLQNLAGKFTI